MATTPKYASAARWETASFSTAETSRTAPTNAVDLIIGVAAGTRVERVRVLATGTTTAGVVRLYWYDGVNYRLFREYLVPAITPSTTVEVFSVEEKFEDFVLPSASIKLRIATHNAEAFVAHAAGSDLT